MMKYLLFVLTFVLIGCASTPQTCTTENGQRSPQSNEFTEQEAQEHLDAVDRFSPVSGSW